MELLGAWEVYVPPHCNPYSGQPINNNYWVQKCESSPIPCHQENKLLGLMYTFMLPMRLG